MVYTIKRVILLLFHLQFWNTDSIGIPVRSLLQGKLPTGLSAQQIGTTARFDSIQIKHLYICMSDLITFADFIKDLGLLTFEAIAFST